MCPSILTSRLNWTSGKSFHQRNPLKQTACGLEPSEKLSYNISNIFLQLYMKKEVYGWQSTALY